VLRRHSSGRPARLRALVLAIACACGGGAAAMAAPTALARPVASPSHAPHPADLAVGMRVLRLVDRSRTIRLAHGRSESRALLTYVRYPTVAARGATDALDAPPAPGEHPLIVFAHGFDVTPAPYARLLQSWARAGFVVAAPQFPLTVPGAPGGPDEADVVEQPRDVSFVISSLLAMSSSGGDPLSGMLDPQRIAVAGHSDGAETALAVAYSRRYRDPRVRAAAVLSGAEMSNIGGYDFTDATVPLLAAQGTRDSFNEPRYTRAYFKAAPNPKYLLWLLHAGHLPPYSYQAPYLGVVERVTTAFFELCLDGEAAAVRRMDASGDVAGVSSLVSDP
jgi:dienelactone hydrolase